MDKTTKSVLSINVNDDLAKFATATVQFKQYMTYFTFCLPFLANIDRGEETLYLSQ